MPRPAPKPEPENEFVRTINRLINRSYLSQIDIATALGYGPHTSIVALWKKGKTRVPLNKVKLLAETVEVDPGHLLRMWLETYEPGFVETLEEVFGGFALNAREQSWIEGLRRDFGVDTPFYQKGMVQTYVENPAAKSGDSEDSHGAHGASGVGDKRKRRRDESHDAAA